MSELNNGDINLASARVGVQDASATLLEDTCSPGLGDKIITIGQNILAGGFIGGAVGSIGGPFGSLGGATVGAFSGALLARQELQTEEILCLEKRK